MRAKQIVIAGIGGASLSVGAIRPKVGCFCSLKAVFSRYSKNEKIVEKFFIYGKNIVFKRLTPIANGGKIVKLRTKD